MLKDSENSRYSSRRTHRTYTHEFKAELVAICQDPSVSIAALAAQHGMNANVLHRWLKEHQQSGCHTATVQVVPTAPSAILESGPQQFVAVRMDVPLVSTDQCAKRSTAIQLELRRGNSTATVTWPSELAGDCGAWLREWLR